MFRFSKSTVGVVIVFILCATTVASAEDWDSSFKIKGDPSGYVNPALQMLLSAPGRYYSIFGRWPSSWQDVKDCGLVQAPLYDPSGTIIDPDARRWTFSGDKHYVPSKSGNPPTIMTYAGGDTALTVDTSYAVADHPRTWQVFVSDLPPEAQGPWLSVINDNDHLVMFELIPLLRESIRMYIRVHGAAPPSFDALLNSRMAPIDRNSINPITKGHFYGDGRANDYLYEPDPEKLNSYTLKPVAADGSMPWDGSYL